LAITVYVDGLVEPRNPGTGTYGFAIYEGPNKLAEGSGLAGEGVTSNYAEYTALLEALKKLKSMGAKDVLVRSDSQLLVGQMGKGWKVKGGMYVEKLKEVKEIMGHFRSVSFEWVPRESNEEADLLTRVAYQRFLRRQKRGAESLDSGAASRFFPAL
jgi:ribonuclease HI